MCETVSSQVPKSIPNQLLCAVLCPHRHIYYPFKYSILCNTYNSYNWILMPFLRKYINSWPCIPLTTLMCKFNLTWAGWKTAGCHGYQQPQWASCCSCIPWECGSVLLNATKVSIQASTNNNNRCMPNNSGQGLLEKEILDHWKGLCMRVIL